MPASRSRRSRSLARAPVPTVDSSRPAVRPGDGSATLSAVIAELLQHDVARGARRRSGRCRRESSAQRSQPNGDAGLDRQRRHVRRAAPRPGSRRPARRRAPSTASTRPGRRCPRRRAGRRRRRHTRHLAAGADEHDLGLAVGVAQHVGALGHASVPAVPSSTGQVLAAQDERGRAVALDRHPPGLGRLVGVGRADHAQARAWPAARRGARSAGGWPSSPTPTESWVHE